MFATIKNFFKRINENIIPIILIVPFLEVILIESLQRRSFLGGFHFIIEQPVSYMVNVLLLMAMFAICLLFRERLFWSFLVGFIWLILGTINFFILGNRVSPFSYTDIKVLSSVASIVRQYMKGWQMIVAVVIFVLCILFLIYLRIRIPKIERKKHFIRDFLFLIVFIGCGILSVHIGRQEFIHTGNITLTFYNHGFVYCFSDSVVDSGIPMPIGYSERAMFELEKKLDKYNPNKKRETFSRPNVIFVQLESVFDMRNMKDYSYTEDPMPFFHRLLDKYSSGYVTVPAFGAGTVNTEFEMITGMSMDYFGLCEYPYKTIIKEKTCESMAYNLEEQGYASAVIHNNRGTFYSRNQVYKNLGFDVFDSEEFMRGLEYNAIGWDKDIILVNEIAERIQSTPQKDYIYAITVQSHGKYVKTDPENPYEITMTGEDDPELKNAFEYYINECRDVDIFIRLLVKKIDEMGEDTIIVFYGDHLPTLEITNEKLVNQNTYQTSYVIWDNIGLKKKDQDLNAFQMSSVIMAKLGYKQGILPRFHQMFMGTKSYDKYLNYLQYDMLYGEQYVYGGVDRYEKSDIQMGLYPVTIEKVRQGNGVVVVKGDHFTEASAIYINGHKADTKFQSEKALLAYGYELEDCDRVTVRQTTSTGGKIGNTEEWIYRDPSIEDGD